MATTLRTIAAFFLRLARVVEGTDEGELFCSHCAPHADESFSSGFRAGLRVAGK